MTTNTTAYTMRGRNNEKYQVEGAVHVVAGLVVYRLPGDLDLNNPARWNIGHHSGYVIAEALRREDALQGAQLLASLHDWTKEVGTLRAEIDDRDIFNRLDRYRCEPVNSNYMRGDVSRNGIYTDADIEQAAAEYRAEGFNALEILTAMSQTVPWMGLDTNDLNEAHDRIVHAAGAE